MESEPIKTCSNCGRNFFNAEDFLRNTSRWRLCEDEHLWFNCTCHSTCMITKGKFDWYNPAQQMSQVAQSIFNTLPSIKTMPRIPSHVMEIQLLIQDEKTTAKQLSAVAKRDPLLASQILKIANAQISLRGQSIESLAHAISYIGIQSLKEIVLVAALQTFKLQTQDFKAELFWEQSFVVGRIAEALCKHFALKHNPDEVYLAGSLCNIGKIVLAICLPETADRYTLELENLSKLGSWGDAELRNQGYDHTILGEIGAAFWGLSEQAAEAASLHHKLPNLKSKNEPGITELVSLANQIAHWILLQPHQMNEPLYKSLCQRFNLTETEAEHLAESLMPLRYSV